MGGNFYQGDVYPRADRISSAQASMRPERRSPPLGTRRARAVQRDAWRAAQPDLDLAHLVFIDETGASTKMARLYGRSPPAADVSPLSRTDIGERPRSLAALRTGDSGPPFLGFFVLPQQHPEPRKEIVRSA